MNIPKLRFKEFTNKWLLLKENIKILSGNMYPLSAYNDTGILLIQGLNIYPKKLNLDKPIYISNEFNAVKHLIIQKNDILIGLNRPIINNELKICKFMYDYAYLYQRAGVLSFNKKKINTDCLYQYLQSHQFIKNLSTELVGSDQPYIKSNLFNVVKIYFPKLEEQNKIAKFLTTVDKKITNLENTITSLENQKKGLLQQIFSQKLRFKDKNGNNYPNWKKKKLGDIFTIKAGGDICKENFSKQYSSEFKYPVYANALTNKGLYGYSNIYKIDKPSITVTGRGDVGFALSRKPFYYPIIRLLVLIPNININFTFFTESINFIHIFNESTGVPQLTAPQLSKVNVYVPNIEEQNKIGNLFDKLNEKIDNKKAQLEHWKQIKKGLLQQMFV